MFQKLNLYGRRTRTKVPVRLAVLGMDGGTTDNGTWRALSDRFKNLDFTYTICVGREVSAVLAPVWKYRGDGMSWAHFRVSILVNVLDALERETEDEGAAYLVYRGYTAFISILNWISNYKAEGGQHRIREEQAELFGHSIA